VAVNFSFVFFSFFFFFFLLTPSPPTTTKKRIMEVDDRAPTFLAGMADLEEALPVTEEDVLVNAAESGDIHTLASLLSKSPRPESWMKSENKALTTAVRCDNLSSTLLLLAQPSVRPDIFSIVETGGCPEHFDEDLGISFCAVLLDPNTNLNQRCPQGHTLLWYAERGRCYSLASFIIYAAIRRARWGNLMHGDRPPPLKTSGVICLNWPLYFQTERLISKLRDDFQACAIEVETDVNHEKRTYIEKMEQDLEKHLPELFLR
jgi:hypothetical protein